MGRTLQAPPTPHAPPVNIAMSALSMISRRWATKKAGGSSRNGRDSQPKMLGVKKLGGEQVTVGNIIIRQRGGNCRRRHAAAEPVRCAYAADDGQDLASSSDPSCAPREHCHVCPEHDQPKVGYEESRRILEERERLSTKDAWSEETRRRASNGRQHHYPTAGGQLSSAACSG
uniref:Uncharacterized protein n=1 Tax=Guillardia theta TaxID=55529 RepID=A0A7S4JQI8_GUITH|mmetsp:Transcript_18061/g.59321  ORF Transcript_18061/g.59321 Transcript_18061/m.59321 type:complete len:173 (+) Transcript_18061:3-521(+)